MNIKLFSDFPALLLAAIVTLSIGGCEKAPRGSKESANVYKLPPVNSIASAFTELAEAAKTDDIVRFWQAHTWEAQSWSGLEAQNQRLWDSIRNTDMHFTLLDSATFRQTVHTMEDTALYARAHVSVTVSGRKERRIDSLFTLLRVDSGRWRVSELSKDAPQRYQEF